MNALESIHWITPEGILSIQGDLEDISPKDLILSATRFEILTQLEIPNAEDTITEKEFLHFIAEFATDQGYHIPKTFARALQLAHAHLNREKGIDSPYRKKLFEIAAGKTDGRAFLRKEWGWISIEGTTLTTHKISPESRTLAQKGLQKITTMVEDPEPSFTLHCETTGEKIPMP